jgi:hypothetical protein
MIVILIIADSQIRVGNVRERRTNLEETTAKIHGFSFPRFQDVETMVQWFDEGAITS